MEDKSLNKEKINNSELKEAFNNENKDDLFKSYFDIESFSLNDFDEIDTLSNDKKELEVCSKKIPSYSKENQNKNLNSVEFYLKSISKYSLISDKEVIELSRRIQENGDKEALHKLVESNLRLAFKIAKNYSILTKTPLEELIQVANKGLLNAAYNFKVDKDAKFSTYATLCIKSEVLKFINVDNKKITISTREFNKTNEINKFIKNFIDKNGVEPSDDEILKEFKGKYSLKQIKDVRNANLVLLDLDETFDDGSSPNDFISDPNENSLVDSIDKEDLLNFIYKEVNCLSEREKFIVIQYCNDVTFTEIGKKIDLTKQRVQQIFNLAIEKIKESIGKID